MGELFTKSAPIKKQILRSERYSSVNRGNTQEPALKSEAKRSNASVSL